MKQTFLLLIGLAFSMASFSQTEIKLEDVSKHIGDSVKVCGKVYGGIFLDRSKDMPTFLNIGGAYPNTPLTLVIRASTRQQFETKPEDFFKDKNICVAGKIALFKEKPQIVIYDKLQITVQ